MIRLLIAALASTFAAAVPHGIIDFPQINQQQIPGAENRCGTIAMGSWFVWLSENGFPELFDFPEIEIPTPFSNTSLPTTTRSALSNLDLLYGGNGEIRLYNLVQGAIEYIHQIPKRPLKIALYYYNLPDETLLRSLLTSEASTILVYGIHRTDPETNLLERVTGHYTCLLSASESALTANTYGNDYRFTLNAIPMKSLRAQDRYRPTGLASLIALKYPEDEFEDYTFRSFAAAQPDIAHQQIKQSGPALCKANETVLLEGALAIWLRKK